MSTSWQRSDPSPALVVHPPAVASLDEAHAAIEQWEHYSGKTLDSAQRLAVELMMAETSDGMWAARTTGRCESRQNGKGDEVEVVEAWGLTQRAEAIVHTAHEIPTAKSAHLRLVAHLEGHRDLRRLVSKVRYANGDQAVEFHNGGIIVYRTRTSGGGRGLDDISRLVVDEAQHAQPEQLASATPILAVAPNPQTNFTGSAGITGRSDWWWSFRKRALEGGPSGNFSWLEHSAETVILGDGGIVQSVPPDPTDREAWRRANPGYPARIPDDYLLEQLQMLGPDLFAREHLSVWDPEPGSVEGGLPAAEWMACTDETYDRSALKPTYAIEVDQDGSAASIAASDGTFGLILEWERGSKWLPRKLAEILADKPGPVWLDPNGPAGALLADLHDAGVEWEEITPRQHAQACGALYAAVVEDQSFRHAGQPVLDIARRQATRRVYGDAWAWDRRKPDGSVSPLGAVTIARWAASHGTTSSVYEERGMVTL